MRIGLILEDVRRRPLPVIEMVDLLGFVTINGFSVAIVQRADGTVEEALIKRLKGPTSEPERIQYSHFDSETGRLVEHSFEPIGVGDGASALGSGGDGPVSSDVPISQNGLRSEETGSDGSIPQTRGSGSKGTKRAANKRQE